MPSFCFSHLGRLIFFPDVTTLVFVTFNLDIKSTESTSNRFLLQEIAGTIKPSKKKNTDEDSINVICIIGASVITLSTGVATPYVAAVEKDQKGEHKIILFRVGWKTGRLYKLGEWSACHNPQHMFIADGPTIIWMDGPSLQLAIPGHSQISLAVGHRRILYVGELSCKNHSHSLHVIEGAQLDPPEIGGSHESRPLGEATDFLCLGLSHYVTTTPFTKPAVCSPPPLPSRYADVAITISPIFVGNLWEATKGETSKESMFAIGTARKQVVICKGGQTIHTISLESPVVNVKFQEIWGDNYGIFTMKNGKIGIFSTAEPHYNHSMLAAKALHVVVDDYLQKGTNQILILGKAVVSMATHSDPIAFGGESFTNILGLLFSISIQEMFCQPQPSHSNTSNKRTLSSGPGKTLEAGTDSMHNKNMALATVTKGLRTRFVLGQAVLRREEQRLASKKAQLNHLYRLLKAITAPPLHHLPSRDLDSPLLPGLLTLVGSDTEHPAVTQYHNDDDDDDDDAEIVISTKEKKTCLANDRKEEITQPVKMINYSSWMDGGEWFVACEVHNIKKSTLYQVSIYVQSSSEMVIINQSSLVQTIQSDAITILYTRLPANSMAWSGRTSFQLALSYSLSPQCLGETPPHHIAFLGDIEFPLCNPKTSRKPSSFEIESRRVAARFKGQVLLCPRGELCLHHCRTLKELPELVATALGMCVVSTANSSKDAILLSAASGEMGECWLEICMQVGGAILDISTSQAYQLAYVYRSLHKLLGETFRLRPQAVDSMHCVRQYELLVQAMENEVRYAMQRLQSQTPPLLDHTDSVKGRGQEAANEVPGQDDNYLLLVGRTDCLVVSCCL